MPKIALLLSLLLASAAFSQTFKNPVAPGSDPWVLFEDGKYYTSKSCKGKSICVMSSKSLTDVLNATPNVVWASPDNGPNSGDVWAPEVHKVEGHWYIYYCADNKGNNDTHRLFILSANTDDPLGPYSEADTGAPHGALLESDNHWGIDPDVFTATDGKLYITWSCTATAGGSFPQRICLARLQDATHVDSGTAVISQPTEPWEMRSAPIQEGPVGLTHNGRTFITYSASASWVPNTYSVGLLAYKGTGDLLNPESWEKSGPIFDHHGKAYGTGSVVFVPSPDQTEWWNIYHGIERLDCNPAYTCRDLRAQRMAWESNGTPFLGYPLDPGVELTLPSGQPGSHGNPPLTQWSISMGDHSQGRDADGVVVGEWEGVRTDSVESKSMGPGWKRIFRELNPNLPDFTVNVGMELLATGQTEGPHRYGIYAAYWDSQNFASFWIDPAKKTLSSYGLAHGQPVDWAACPLPEEFNPKVLHHLKVTKLGGTFQASVDGAPVTGPCSPRNFPLDNGQVGVITEDASVAFRRLTVTPEKAPPPPPPPPPAPKPAAAPPSK